jgi:hypothetical protein
MTDHSLLERARQRRIDALAQLKNRESNLFSIADFRLRQNRMKPVSVFRSTRATPASLAVEVDIDERMAA